MRLNDYILCLQQLLFLILLLLPFLHTHMGRRLLPILFRIIWGSCWEAVVHKFWRLYTYCQCKFIYFPYWISKFLSITKISAISLALSLKLFFQTYNVLFTAYICIHFNFVTFTRNRLNWRSYLCFIFEVGFYAILRFCVFTNIYYTSLLHVKLLFNSRVLCSLLTLVVYHILLLVNGFESED